MAVCENFSIPDTACYHYRSVTLPRFSLITVSITTWKTVCTLAVSVAVVKCGQITRRSLWLRFRNSFCMNRAAWSILRSGPSYNINSILADFFIEKRKFETHLCTPERIVANDVLCTLFSLETSPAY